ncbi:alpha/beta fold hydrolase [Streptomyces sp. NPDC002073]|uniref:alpha/beta fold hydrolase n=1 Tax=Streptomyces sp. NBC_00239 TaxID=2903640 RepID=UPI002E28D030|nr:alpha/beta hydrolase [Streptomyces sp. NBC_00239]
MNTVQSADGTTIAYTRSGEGEPLILVGGSFSERAHPVMTQLAEQLAPHFTVYNYDRRGRGDSGDADEYAVEREIEDLAALIAEAGGAAKVFGMSAGGALALKAAASGVPITKLALYDTPFIIGEDGPTPPADFTEQLKELTSAERRGDAVEFFMVQGMGAPAEAVAGMRFAPFWGDLESLAHTLPYDTTIMGDFSVPAELADVKAPVLAVYGGNAAPWLHAAAHKVAETVPDCKHQALAGQDIAPDPAVLAPELKNFLAG